MESPHQGQMIIRAYELWEQAATPEARAEQFDHQVLKRICGTRTHPRLGRTPDTL